MSLGLIVSVCIVIASLSAYFFYLARQQRAERSPEEKFFAEDGNGSERAISESPIYQSTKEQIKQLRSDLDRFSDTLDSLSPEVVNGSTGELDAAYSEGIPKMHRALVDARNAAEQLLASVEARPSNGTVNVKVVGNSHHAPAPYDMKASFSHSDRLYGELLETGSRVSHSIAGFYFALTEGDENSQAVQAVAQVKLIIEQLDHAISSMIALEEELAD